VFLKSSILAIAAEASKDLDFNESTKPIIGLSGALGNPSCAFVALPAILLRLSKYSLPGVIVPTVSSFAYA